MKKKEKKLWLLASKSKFDKAMDSKAWLQNLTKSFTKTVLLAPDGSAPSLLESTGSGKGQKQASVPTLHLLPAPSAKQPGKLPCTVTREQISAKSWPSGSKNRPWIPV